jgi:hypothetical protein
MPLIPFKWQKRFDRILIKSDVLIPESIDLWANKKIHSEENKICEIQNFRSKKLEFMIKWFLRSITSFFFDFFGINIWRNKKSYLFPSDHFGVYSNLKHQN